MILSVTFLALAEGDGVVIDFCRLTMTMSSLPNDNKQLSRDYSSKCHLQQMTLRNCHATAALGQSDYRIVRSQ